MIEALSGGLAETIDDIRRGHQSRGYQGRGAEEIEAGRKEGEADYEKRTEFTAASIDA